VSRLLAIRPGGIGDCILSFPAIESLRGRCDYLEVWVPGAVVPLVRFADRVRSIASTGLELVGIPGVQPDHRVLEALNGFDAIVSWYGTNREAFREACRELPIEFHAPLPPAGSAIHACDFFCSQVQAPAGMTPSIPVNGGNKRDFVAVHPFSGSAKKNWPLEKFDAIGAVLNLEWCCTPEQLGTLGSRVPVLACDDLAAVAQWVADARVYVGNDSGITHLAAAIGTPVLALFSPESDARVWAPRGKLVELLQSPDIGTVAAAIRKIVSK
jgi:hypothetical protein